MPCYDPYVDTYHDEQKNAKINELTRLLCGLCGTVESLKWPFCEAISDVPGLTRWWNDHKKMDENRNREELP